MSRTVVITKEQVIEALRTEPLTAGSWVEKKDLHIVGNCRVCAVGAALRSAGLTNAQIYATATSLSQTANNIGGHGRPSEVQADIQADLAAGRYFPALSCLFESMLPTCGAPNDAQRQVVVDFVTNNFPDTMTIEVQQ